ncbi:MAG: hypothetical protein ACP5PX_07285 [Candidatus Hadarchaeum sp.]|uniref:hypothetical protein n=1 Tax=Candidatus Hadarchaeum sp. TaxID=2883567 RepID=UPI003D0B5D5C
MATWKKAVVVALAAMVAAFPAFAQVTVAEEVQSVLPAGEELPDTELLGAEGEAAWYLVALLDAGIAGASAVGIHYVGRSNLDPGLQAACIGGIAAVAAFLVGASHYLLSDR